MHKIIISFLLFFSFLTTRGNEIQDYEVYHKQVIEAERLIASEKYPEALLIYESLFEDYDFVFLKEYQIASQLALYLNDEAKAIRFLKQGIGSGWKMKSLKKNKFLKERLKDEVWKSIKKEYPNLHLEYESKLNIKIQQQVKKMYSKDQRNALKALFRFSSKAQDNYAEKKFAPHSERQMKEVAEIMQTYGYPSEKLIGNTYWMATILSHHNSISTAYNKKDSLYPKLRPLLEKSLKKGEISPYEFLTIDDWYVTVKYDRTRPTYGTLDVPSEANLSATNALRKDIYARPYELRAALVSIQNKTGMNFYLPDRWR